MPASQVLIERFEKPTCWRLVQKEDNATGLTEVVLRMSGVAISTALPPVHQYL